MADKMVPLTKSDGRTFEMWLEVLDLQYWGRLGMSYQDLPDAPYRRYYDEDLTPKQAMRAALEEYQDEAEFLDLDELGI